MLGFARGKYRSMAQGESLAILLAMAGSEPKRAEFGLNTWKFAARAKKTAIFPGNSVFCGLQF
jgi:hypothetical protein